MTVGSSDGLITHGHVVAAVVAAPEVALGRRTATSARSCRRLATARVRSCARSIIRHQQVLCEHGVGTNAERHPKLLAVEIGQ